MKPQNFSTVNVMRDCKGYETGICIRFSKEDLVSLQDTISTVLNDDMEPTWYFKTAAGIYNDQSTRPFSIMVEDYPKVRRLRPWKRIIGNIKAKHRNKLK